jgi:hypothetical protein
MQTYYAAEFGHYVLLKMHRNEEREGSEDVRENCGCSVFGDGFVSI